MIIINKVKQVFGLEDKIELTQEFIDCLNLLENTSYNLFITGKAGTGKSTLIQYFRDNTKKKVVVLAPTGLAAVNVRGQTVHSFFKFPPKLLTREVIKEVRSPEVYRNLDTILIDEASMLRADLLDAIDRFLRLNGKDKNKPFGGIQIILSGDLYQLPPVVTSEELPIFNEFYTGPYFFNANSYSDIFQTVILEKIFRQHDMDFINILNAIRFGEATSATLELINKNVNGSLIDDHHIVLCTTNAAAEAINNLKLNFIDRPLYKFAADIEGIFPTEERNLPFILELKLKKGARVLFIRNDREGRRWVNGSIGTVHEVSQDQISIKLDSGETVDVGRETWENIRYEYNKHTGEVNEEILGRIKQYPLKLAWAITIHKSQGMTFDKVCIDLRRSPFAHGQTYVALSRCRTLEGIVLTKPVNPNDVIVDERIVEFHKKNIKSS